MLESIFDFGGYILNQCAPKRDIEELRPAAYREHRNLHVTSCLNQRDLGLVAGEVGFATTRRSGLSIKRRFYIFAAGEEKAVNAGKNRLYRFVSRKRRHDEWYQSCTFECGDVRAVQSHTMKLVVACIGSRRHGNDGGSAGGSQ